MPVEALRNMTAGEVRRAVNGFSRRYVDDWNKWLSTGRKERPRRFGEILRKWQATRPDAMRRLKVEAQHGPLFLDELFESAAEPLRVLAGLSVSRIAHRTREQDKAPRQTVGELLAIADCRRRVLRRHFQSCSAPNQGEDRSRLGLSGSPRTQRRPTNHLP